MFVCACALTNQKDLGGGRGNFYTHNALCSVCRLGTRSHEFFGASGINPGGYAERESRVLPEGAVSPPEAVVCAQRLENHCFLASKWIAGSRECVTSLPKYHESISHLYTKRQPKGRF